MARPTLPDSPAGTPVQLRWRQSTDLSGPQWARHALLWRRPPGTFSDPGGRSEEHTSELQSLRHLVCRLLLEKKKTNNASAEGIHRSDMRHSCRGHFPGAYWHNVPAHGP